MQAINRTAIIRSVVISIFLNGLLPYAIYNVLKPHTTSLSALVMAMVLPIFVNGYQLVKEKKTDAFGLFMMFGFFMSIIVLFLGGDERLILMRESFVTALSGLLFIGSLAYKRPMIYYFALKFTTEDSKEDRMRFNENWQLPFFRKTMYVLTFGWGMMLLLEAGVKCFLIYYLPVSTFLAISQFVFYGFMGSAIYWNIWYVKCVKRKFAKA